MKYYKDTEGNLYADPASTEGLEEVLSPVRVDGTVLPQHDAVGSLALQEDGTRYSHYYEVSDPDGVYQPDTQKILEAEEAVEAEALKEAESLRKLEGVEFEGTFCSATAEDMWGLSSVESWVRLGISTPFKFDNGNTLTLTVENIDQFYAVWTPFRASFF